MHYKPISWTTQYFLMNSKDLSGKNDICLYLECPNDTYCSLIQWKILNNFRIFAYATGWKILNKFFLSIENWLHILHQAQLSKCRFNAYICIRLKSFFPFKRMFVLAIKFVETIHFLLSSRANHTCKMCEKSYIIWNSWWIFVVNLWEKDNFLLLKY